MLHHSFRRCTLRFNIEDIRRQYADLSDEGLLEIDRDDLVDQARHCYDAELSRRGLTLDNPSTPVARESLPDEPPPVTLPYVRHGVGAVRPYLYGTLDLLEFVETVFHSVELERHEFSPTALHLEVMIGDSVLVLELSDPPDPSARPASIYVYVEDVDAAYNLALESGATSIAEPVDKPYQERAAGVQDSFRNTWWISTYIGE